MFSAPDQIASVIDTSMGSINAIVNQAKSCTASTDVAGPKPSQPPAFPHQPACPPAANPYTCKDTGTSQRTNVSADPKADYDAWLFYVSGALRSYEEPTIDQRLGRDSNATTFGGLGSEYGKVAEKAQRVEQLVANCNRVNTPNGSDDDCGKAVDCQAAKVQEKSFLNVGETIFEKFKGCSSGVRQQASDYLNAKYSW